MQVDQASRNWAAGNYLATDPQATQRANIEILTKVECLKGLINMSYDDYKECFNE